MAKFFRWTSIESFRNIAHDVQSQSLADEFPVTYNSKIKLHGTNAGINFSDEGIFAQKRSAIIESGHMGFAGFVKDNFKDNHVFPEKFIEGDIAVVFGEWCGTGVQKGVACSMVDKFFAIFAIKLISGEDIRIIHDPESIKEYLGVRFTSLLQVKVLPYFECGLRVDYLNAESMDKFITAQLAHVDAVEACDPFMKDVFGVEGIGEGLVYFPIKVHDSYTNPDRFTKFMLKIKGNKHANIKVKDRKAINPEAFTKINELCRSMCPESRLEQGLSEVFGEEAPVLPRMGNFIEWVCRDVQKECMREIDASGFEWKEVSRSVAKRASAFLNVKIKESQNV